ncbi:MAG TPA: hypothetical protein VLT16_09210 [Candidatus Limnocylindrales bacterium]|nr:hypothetical protein [Candidatus Limnocylindrales bacterium]
MKRAAIGIRVHSGWGALVAVSGASGDHAVVERSRVVIIDPGTAGMAQPYHFAESMKVPEAEKHIAACAAASAQMALEAMREIVGRMRGQGFQLAGSALLLSSGRPLPRLEKILAAHPLIHTAEGEFFRDAFRRALEELRIPVIGIRERELEERARAVFGKAAPRVCAHINQLGHSLGPPWTQDQKAASLAAAIVLAEYN